MGEAVGDGGWGAAPRARRAAAARGLGTESGIANDSSGARTGASGAGTGLGVVIARRRTLANSSRSGTWGEVRTAAARMTGTRTRNCCEPGEGSSNGARCALRTALANAGGVDWRPRSLVAMDRRGGRALMKLCSRTASACRCAAAEHWICCWALSRSVRTMSRSRLRDSRSPCATASSCCWASYRSRS